MSAAAAASAASNMLDTASSKELMTNEWATELQLIETKQLEELFKKPLWLPRNMRVAEVPIFGENNLIHFWKEDSSWDFWSNWYGKMRDGKPIDWELQTRIALIEHVYWERGVEAVAAEIERISSQFRLEQSVNNLEHTLKALKVLEPRYGIGGNKPPAHMQIEPQVVRETTIIWAAVDELKAETEKETPDPTKLEKSAEAIESVKRSWGQFFAQKLEISTDEFFKEFGKWSGRLATASLPAGALLLLETLGKLEPLLQALRNYISILVG